MAPPTRREAVRARRALAGRGGLLAALAACAALAAWAALAASQPASAQEQRARWHTRVLALVPPPGFPAHAYPHPNGRIYAGTYDNPSGDTVPSRVFEYTAEGTLVRSWTVRGQDLSRPHGVQVATSDARGRLVLLDKSPPRALVLDRRSGEQIPYAAFGEGSIPNFAAWGPDGSLYVTDYGEPVLWRVPPGGGEPQPWLRDPRLDGGDFGTTGIALAGDGRTLLVAQQSEAGGAAGNPSTGRLFTVPIDPAGAPGELTELWESRPVDGPDGFAVARSGNVYVALLAANQLVAIGPDGRELERFPAAPGGENGSSVPFDSPSSARFLGTRLVVAQQSFFAGDPARQAILDVETGEEGLPELIPASAGPGDLVAPRLRGVRLAASGLRLALGERARVSVLVERRERGRWRRLRRSTRTLRAGRHRLALRRLAGARRLAPGPYRVTVVARDGAGNASAPVRRSARIRARR